MINSLTCNQLSVCNIDAEKEKKYHKVYIANKAEKDNIGNKIFSRSLTCNQLSICNMDAEKDKTYHKVYFADKEEKDDMGNKIFSRFYVNIPQKNRKLYALIDNGSDISLLRENLAKQLFSYKELDMYKQKSNISVKSFSGDNINILFDLVLPCQFIKNTENVNITFRVFNNIKQYPILFGQDAMKKVNMRVTYTLPTVEIFFPKYAFLPTEFTSPENENSVSAFVTLKPKEIKNVIFKPHAICTVQKGTKVLIENSSHPKIHVIPTRYTAYMHKNVPFIASVINLSDEYISTNVDAELTDIEDHTFVNKYNSPEILKNIKQVRQEALNYEYSTDLPALHVLDDLPKENTKALTEVKSFLLLTPYESKNRQTAPEKESKIIKNKNEENITEELNALVAPPEETPDSPAIEIPPDILNPAGYTIPCNLQPTVSELLDLNRFDPDHRPYLKDIFIDKYPTIVALHAYDIGDISKTLGYYTIKLKDNETLPTFRKIYFMNAQDHQAMLDITSFLIKFDVIERASHRDDIAHLAASPGYLVARADQSASPRLIIDYTLINQIIKTSPPNIPSITSVLQNLRNQAIFSSIDLTSAFYSIELDPSCRYITRFATQTGSYTFKRLAMGLSLSPTNFAEYCHRMIHMKPILNEKSEPIFLEHNVIKMKHDLIPNVHIFYDDVLMTSPMFPTIEETIKEHYKVVEKVMERLAFHKAKLSIVKSKFGQFSIQFLGWNISNNFLLPDPTRTKKLLATTFPENVKAMRSFLGLLNTLRTVLPHNFLTEMTTLNPLTSATEPYSPEQKHRDAFEKLKVLLTTSPVYSNIVDPNLKKILFTDASDKGCYSAVLGQLQPTDSDIVQVPSHLLLDDKVDQIIFAHKLCFEPVPLYLHDEYILRSKLNPPYLNLPYKDPAYLKEEFLGHTEKSMKNSFLYCIRSIQYAYGNTLIDISQIKSQIKEKMHKHIIKYKLIQNLNNSQAKFKEFLEPLEDDILPIDDDFLMVEFIAQIISRPIILISSLDKHKTKPIFKFQNQIQKPAFILGVHEKKNKRIFLPYFINKQASFNLSEIKDQFQIISFYSKAISSKDYDKAIQEKELFGIISALAAFKPLVGQSEIILLTDSKPLFLLYTNPVTKSSSKLCRWGLKLSSEYHNLKLRFVSTRQNLADFLSRDLNIQPIDIKRLPLKNIVIPDLDEYINPNQEFTVEEWKTFVKKHEHLMKLPDTASIEVTTNAISKVMKNMNKVLDPLEHLHAKMSHENIGKEQEKEFKSIINVLITEPDMEGTILDKSYKLQNGLLYSYQDESLKLLLPQALEGIFLSFNHLAHNHLGVKNMISSLKYLDFPQKIKKIKHLAERCYGCSLQNSSTRKIILGTYPVPEFTFQYIHMDLLENLPMNRKYSHILLVVCPLSKFLLCYPLKDKTPNMVMYNFVHNLYQFVNVQYILTDNGPVFNNKEFLTLVTALNIKKIKLAALHSISNGFAEIFVKKLKYALKKTLTTSEEYQWLDILPLLVKHFNSTPNPLTNLSPLQILHGENSLLAEKFISDRPPNKIYPFLENIKSHIEAKQEENKKIMEFIRNELHIQKIHTTEKLNRTRQTPDFQVGQYCFVKDNKIIIGSTRPLKSLYSHDPWVILKTLPTTAVVRRLADGYATIYGYGDLKKYNRLDPTFSILPQSVRDILIHKFEDLNQLSYSNLRKYATLELTQNERLFNIDEETKEQIDEIEENLEESLPDLPELNASIPTTPLSDTHSSNIEVKQNEKTNTRKKLETNTTPKRITRSMKLQLSDDSDSSDSENEREKKTVKFAK